MEGGVTAPFIVQNSTQTRGPLAKQGKMRTKHRLFGAKREGKHGEGTLFLPWDVTWKPRDPLPSQAPLPCRRGPAAPQRSTRGRRPPGPDPSSRATWLPSHPQAEAEDRSQPWLLWEPLPALRAASPGPGEGMDSAVAESSHEPKDLKRPGGARQEDSGRVRAFGCPPE